MTASETLDQIKTNCMQYFELEEDPFDVDNKKSRKAELIRARWFVYFIASETFNFSKVDISKHFNVDYQTVTGGIRNLKYTVTYDAKAIRDFNNLRTVALKDKRVRTRIENIVYDEVIRNLPNTRETIAERIAFLSNIQIMKLLT